MNPTQTPTTSDEALQQLNSYQNGLQTPQQALTAAQGQYGTQQAQQTVQGLRQAIQNTTSMLNNVAPSVQGRTGNSLVTSAQANQIINNEQAPISNELAGQNTAYSNANDDYQKDEAESEAAANDTLTGQQSQLGYLQNIYNDLYTKEKDASDLAEQQRESDAATKAASGGGISLGGSSLGTDDSTSSAAAPSVAAQKSQAAQWVNQFINSGNATTILNNLTGAMKSANNGNQLDAMKLELARAAYPGYFNSDGSVNSSRINYLKSQGLLK